MTLLIVLLEKLGLFYENFNNRKKLTIGMIIIIDYRTKVWFGFKDVKDSSLVVTVLLFAGPLISISTKNTI